MEMYLFATAFSRNDPPNVSCAVYTRKIRIKKHFINWNIFVGGTVFNVDRKFILEINSKFKFLTIGKSLYPGWRKFDLIKRKL